MGTNLSEKSWKSVTANIIKNGNYEILLTRTDNTIVAVEVSAIPVGDIGLIRALEIAEEHRNCDCEIGRYKEHKEFRRKNSV